MAPELELDGEEVELATSLAEASHAKHGARSGHYPNLKRSHLVGKLGEVAVEKWLRLQEVEVDAAYKDPGREREPDLIADARGIAVKTWRPDTWTDWGRCVTPAQVPGLQKKVEAIVWAVVDDNAEPVRAEIAGWSTPDEVAGTEVRATGPKYRPIMNHQVDLDQLRDPTELIDALRRAD